MSETIFFACLFALLLFGIAAFSIALSERKSWDTSGMHFAAIGLLLAALSGSAMSLPNVDGVWDDMGNLGVFYGVGLVIIGSAILVARQAILILIEDGRIVINRLGRELIGCYICARIRFGR